MVLSPQVRKLALTAHVVASVGWLGSVAAFLALALTGLRSENAETLRAVYLSAELVTWGVILPLCAAALITGVISRGGHVLGTVPPLLGADQAPAHDRCDSAVAPSHRPDPRHGGSGLRW